MERTDYNGLNASQKRLLEAAEQAMETAYNPYSHFFVGAAFLADDDTIISASNMENAAYGSTICAERIALGKANSMGYRMLKKLAVIGRGEGFDAAEPVTPCGSCRQMIYEASEISGTDIEIIMSSTRKDRITISTIGELLPLPFGPKALGIDVEKYRH